MATIALKVNGKTATLSEERAKKTQNIYYALGGPAGSIYGVKVPAFDKALPTEVELAGVKVPLPAASKRERDGKLSTSAAPTLTIDGDEKTGKVVFTDHGNGTWQVTAAIFGKGGGGGSAVRTDLFT